ncbi:MAG TPA: hypothetical protein VK773_00225 [Acidimicrobiales bacterium]|jgi:hypothetical protein|nr:hypothetical protein [Acidimicrobiales bacterium]
MADAAAVVRALDPVERYFWLLTEISDPRGVLFAYVDRTLDEAQLAGALRALQRRHPLLNVRIEVVDGELVFVRVPGEIPITVLPRGAGEPVPVAQVQAMPFAPAPHPLVRCIYAPTESGDGSALFVVVHHAFLDANTTRILLQNLVRVLDRGEDVLGASDAVPAPMHSRYPEALRKPRAALDVLEAIRAEREGQPEPSTFPFHHRLAQARVARNDLLIVGGDALTDLLARAKSVGSSVTGLIGAIVLQAGAALFDDDPDDADADAHSRMLCLASATDLRPRVEPPLPPDEVAVAIGMLCTPYLVSASTQDSLGRTITDQIVREVERGESHLFYRFARVASYPPTEAGLESFGQWIDGSPQNITVSSLGRIDDEGDPPWLRRLSASMFPGSNQLCFTATTTYRGELVFNISTDAAKMSPETIDFFVAGIAARAGAQHEQTTTCPIVGAPRGEGPLTEQ